MDVLMVLCTDMHNNLASYGCSNTKYRVDMLLCTDMPDLTSYGCVSTKYGVDILLCTNMLNLTSYGYTNTKYGVDILLCTDMLNLSSYGCVITKYGCAHGTLYGYAQQPCILRMFEYKIQS